MLYWERSLRTVHFVSVLSKKRPCSWGKYATNILNNTAEYHYSVLTPHDLLVDPQRLEISEQFEFSHLDVVDSFLDLDNVGIAEKETEYTSSLASGFDDEITQPSPSNANARGQAPEPGQTLSLEREATCNKQAFTGETSKRAMSYKPSRPIEKVGVSSRIRKRNVNSRQRCFLEQELSPKNIAQLQELAGIDRVGADLQVNVFARLALAINRTSSNSYLKALLDGYSRKEVSRSQPGSTNFLQMSLQDRFRRILVLDEQLEFHGFLRTFHVYKLVSDVMCEHQDTQGSFLITSIESAASATPRSPGNPLVRAQAQLHETMMKRIFPDLPKGGSLYNQKYEEIKHMRRHGCRLGQIASRFGEGLFALVPFHGTPIDPLIGLFGHAWVIVGATKVENRLTDRLRRCRTFSDGRWASFIELLSTHQGESIRSTCRDYRAMVEQLFCGTLQASGRTTFVEPDTAHLPERPIRPQMN